VVLVGVCGRSLWSIEVAIVFKMRVVFRPYVSIRVFQFIEMAIVCGVALRIRMLFV
jgi:hypothetical protein